MYAAVVTPDPDRQIEQPLSPMRASAIMLHEWFENLRAAGFSEEQALTLIVGSMSTNRGDEQH